MAVLPAIPGEIDLKELLHQTDEILLIERSGAVGAGVEETPHLFVVFQGIENELLFDDVLFEQFLVESADGALQGVRDTEVLGGDQFGSSGKSNLEDAAAHIDLHEVDQFLLKRTRAEARRIEFDLHTRQQAVPRTYKIGADGVKVRRCSLPEGRDLAGTAQKALVFLGQGVDILGQAFQSCVPCLCLVRHAGYHTSLTATAGFPQFRHQNELQNVNLQTAENLV